MKPNILLFDLETAPYLGYTWGKYDQTVLTYEEERFLLCFAWKWLGQKSIHSLSLPQFRTYGLDKHNDEKLVKSMHALFQRADIIIGHNARSFDCKVANAMFVRHHLPPPSDYKVVDTKEVAKRHFRFSCNKLDDIAQYLRIGKKHPTTGINLWLQCMLGNRKAWKRMIRYNKNDVILLEHVYLRMRPYMDRHPNYNVLIGRAAVCPNCGGKTMYKRGYYITRLCRAQKYQCQTCGAWSHGRPQRIGVELR